MHDMHDMQASDGDISRRTALRLSVGAGIALSLRRLAGLDALVPQGGALIQHAIPSSGEKLTVVGIGTRDFGSATREALSSVLAQFPALGGQIIDTAPSYGGSEAAIGDLTATLKIRPKLFLANKVNAGRAANAATEVQSQFEAGLTRLKTDKLDLLQIHNLAAVDQSLPLLREWKQSGRIRYVGVTTSSIGQYGQMATIMRAQTLDFIQVDYAINAREAADMILPLARDHGMGVLVNLPFGRTTAFGKTTNKPLPGWAKEIECTTWAQVFLKYVVSHPAVTATIPGTRSLDHVLDNMAAAHGTLPDAALRTRIEKSYDSL
jgi:aryl-alcohol dehydrogenase-like predicted oxidoreductase